MKRLNKKGQFFSILVVIAIILLGVFFYYRADAANREDALYVQRVRISNMNNFVKTFDEIYIKQILETAAKPAIAGRINNPSSFTKFSKADVVDIMKDGKEGGTRYIEDSLTTDNAYKQAMSTLSYAVAGGGLFDYTLDSVRQPDYKTIELEFIVEYEFASFDNTWSKTGKHITIQFLVYSLRHPTHGRQVIEKNWVHDSSGACFVNNIFIDADSCTQKNIKPPSIAT